MQMSLFKEMLCDCFIYLPLLALEILLNSVCPEAVGHATLSFFSIQKIRFVFCIVS